MARSIAPFTATAASWKVVARAWQVKTATKSNEITAIEVLLDLRSIEPAVVTIDAMGCQREIARKIVDKGADLGNAGSNGP